MPKTLFAGAARQIINPPLGMLKIGGRLFGGPIQAIESDLIATALVLSDGSSKIVILAVDLCTVSAQIATQMRERVAQALGISKSHVLFNESHDHSVPALPGYYSESYESSEPHFGKEYLAKLEQWLVNVAKEADSKLQPARIGAGWGECHIGVYRREVRDGRTVIGEVPGHPIDPSVGVIRVDDLDGSPIAIVFRYSCHPVTVGGRSMVASADFPGPARQVLERTLGGVALFLQGCGGNINPTFGIGYEVDCRDIKNRSGMALGGEALKVAASIRTNRQPGARKPLGNVPNILFTPWEPVEGDTCTYLGATEQTVKLAYGELPSMAEAEAIHSRWQETLDELCQRDAQEWEIRVAAKWERWARTLVAAVQQGKPVFDLNIHIVRVNDIVIAGLNVEAFFETGLAIKEQSPFRDTFVLGYTDGSMAYLPRAQDYPTNGWKLNESYVVPDMLVQFYTMPVALRPDAEQRAIDAALDGIKQLVA